MASPWILHYRNLRISAPGCWLRYFPKNICYRVPSFTPWQAPRQAASSGQSHFLLPSEACGLLGTHSYHLGNREQPRKAGPGPAAWPCSPTKCAWRWLSSCWDGAACMVISFGSPNGSYKNPPTFRVASGLSHTVPHRWGNHLSYLFDLHCPYQWKTLVMNYNESHNQLPFMLTYSEMPRIMEQDLGTK